MNSFSGLNSTIAQDNFSLYTRFNQDINRCSTEKDTAMVNKRIEGTLVLGVKGNCIVTVEQSKWCFVRFFQAIANFFRGVDKNPAKVKELRDASTAIHAPNTFKAEKAYEFVAKKASPAINYVGSNLSAAKDYVAPRAIATFNYICSGGASTTQLSP